MDKCSSHPHQRHFLFATDYYREPKPVKMPRQEVTECPAPMDTCTRHFCIEGLENVAEEGREDGEIQKDVRLL